MRFCTLLATLAALATTVSVSVAADDADVDRVRRFVEDVHTLRATFTQDVIDRDNQVVESSRGQVALARPGRFRWDYRERFEREIVADGERVWLYEADLDQVTVRRMNEGLGATPAALLTGSIDILDSFELLGSEHRDGLAWVSLGPLAADADFASISLGFTGDQLTELMLADRLGQTTRLRFSDIERNPELADETFRFIVPEGADVIGEGEL